MKSKLTRDWLNLSPHSVEDDQDEVMTATKTKGRLDAVTMTTEKQDVLTTITVRLNATSETENSNLMPTKNVVVVEGAMELSL